VKAEIARVDQIMRLEVLRAEADAVIARFQAARVASPRRSWPCPTTTRW